MKKQLFLLIYCVAIITTGRVFTAAQPTQNDLTCALVQVASRSNIRQNTSASDLAEVRRLIAQGARVNERCDRGDLAGATALLMAAGSGRLDTVRYLVEQAGADVNITSGIGESALIAAATHGNVDVVGYLVSVPGIDLNKRCLAVEGLPAETALEAALRVLQDREREIVTAPGLLREGLTRKIQNYERIIGFLVVAGAAPATQGVRLASDIVELLQRADVPVSNKGLGALRKINQQRKQYDAAYGAELVTNITTLLEQMTQGFDRTKEVLALLNPPVLPEARFAPSASAAAQASMQPGSSVGYSQSLSAAPATSAAGSAEDAIDRAHNFVLSHRVEIAQLEGKYREAVLKLIQEISEARKFPASLRNDQGVQARITKVQQTLEQILAMPKQ